MTGSTTLIEAEVCDLLFAHLERSPVLAELVAERQRQDDKWGEQNHPDGTGRPGAAEDAVRLRAACQANGSAGDNWRDILAEEVAEAFAEVDPARLRAELVQVAAVVVAWIEAIDRRSWCDRCMRPETGTDPVVKVGPYWIHRSHLADPLVRQAASTVRRHWRQAKNGGGS